MRGGWFSDRSVCYLASGRPVLIEDTDITEHLSVGDGLLTFRNVEEAVAGMDAINSRYDHHQQAARAMAESVFATDVILPQFLRIATG